MKALPLAPFDTEQSLKMLFKLLASYNHDERAGRFLSSWVTHAVESDNEGTLSLFNIKVLSRVPTTSPIRTMVAQTLLDHTRKLETEITPISDPAKSRRYCHYAIEWAPKRSQIGHKIIALYNRLLDYHAATNLQQPLQDILSIITQEPDSPFLPVARKHLDPFIERLPGLAKRHPEKADDCIHELITFSANNAALRGRFSGVARGIAKKWRLTYPERAQGILERLNVPLNEPRQLAL
jgi:hypothetical protein